MSSSTVASLPTSEEFLAAYRLNRRLLLAAAVGLAAVVIAGFWNFHFVDGFGRDVIAGRTIGDTATLSSSYFERGGAFGFLFAAVAGLAATFTACNCVAFAMIPGLACSSDRSATRAAALRALWTFSGAVMLVGGAYGIFVGFLGPEGMALFNERSVRLAQAQAVFSLLGVGMLIWAAFELGFLESVRRRVSPLTREFFAQPTTKAALMGLLVGLFAVGRPFPVFREFLTYAASAESPTYGALVMIIHGVGQIAVLVGLFVLMVWLAGPRLIDWVRRSPHQPRLVTGLALLAGGVYFVFYWGLAFVYDVGRWGYKLGWYGT